MDIQITTAVLIFFSILRFAVVVPLFQTASRNNLVNLYWLSAQFLCLVIAVPFAKIGAFNNTWIFWTFISLTEICLIMFVHTTFYQGRKSPAGIFLAVVVIGMLGGAYGTITDNFEFSAWSVYPLAAAIWVWHFFEARRASNFIKKDEDTVGWIKGRYKLMIAYSALDFFSAVMGTLTTTGIWGDDLASLIVVLINMLSVGTQILTWVMPVWLKNLFNRSYTVAQAAERAEQVNAMLDVIATSMTKEGRLTKMICMYSIRATAGKIINTQDSSTINTYISRMGFPEWNSFLQHPELHRLLTNAVADLNLKRVVENAQRSLVDKQSLFSLSAK